MKKIVLLLASAIVGIAFCDIETDVVSVKGKGVGVDETAALKDAYRDAVETAVGLYVDVEQMEKNEELIKDQILTQSNAYIDGYKLTGKTEKDGLVSVKIMARVKKQALTKKISGVMPSSTVSVGDSLQNLFAKTITVQSKEKDGAKLIANALDGVNPVAQFFNVTIADPKGIPVGDASGETVTIDYLFKMEVDGARYYDEFLPKLVRILEQISTVHPKPVRCTPNTTISLSNRGEEFEKQYLEANEYNRGERSNPMWGSGVKSGFVKFDISGVGAWRGRSCHTPDSKGGRVVVIEKANSSSTLIKGRTFVVDEKVQKSILDWRRGLEKMNKGVPSYVVSFLDESGDSVTEQAVSFPRLSYDQASCEGFIDFLGQNEPSVWMVTPWFGGDAKCYYQWFRFKLPKNDLPKIKSIKVEIAN